MAQTETVVAASFRLTFGDLFRILFWFSFRKLWFMTIVAPICVAITALTSRDASQGDNLPLAVTIVGALWVLTTWVSPYLATRAAMKNPNFQGEIHYAFSDAGIDTSAKHQSSHVDWEMVTRVYETSRFFVLTFSVQNVVNPVPKSCLSPEDLVTLRALMRSHVKGKLRLKG